MSNQKTVLLFLKISIASVFLYAAIASTIEPINWIGYIPKFATIILPAQKLLLIFSFYEFVLGIWILSSWKTLYASLLSAVTLLGIILGNFSDLDILFRDFAIFFAAVALAVGSYKKSASEK